MSGIILIVNVVAISLSAIALAMGAISGSFHKSRRNSWYVVFQSCIFSTIFLAFLDSVSSSFFSPKVALVFNYIFMIMQHCTMAFVTVLIPYFLALLFSKKWGAIQRIIFYPFGILYFAAGLVSVLIRNEFIGRVIQTPVFLVAYISCLVFVLINYKNISEPHTRNMVLAIGITSCCLIPLSIGAFFDILVEGLSYPAYVMGFSIIMIAFFANRNKIDSEIFLNSKSTKIEIPQNCAITKREEEVIKLVCDGLTNKEIAARLNISVNTVNNHVANIFEKLGIASRVELVRAVHKGLWS